MIITHTFNPSIDITYNVEQLQLGTYTDLFQTIKNSGRKRVECFQSVIAAQADLSSYLFGWRKWPMDRKTTE